MDSTTGQKVISTFIPGITKYAVFNTIQKNLTESQINLLKMHSIKII